MAIAELNPRIARDAVQTFEDRKERRTSNIRSMRLTEPEIAELDYVWHGMAAELGCRSVHGALEAQLLRSVPRDSARKRIIEELDRAGGLADEGRVLLIVESEWAATRYETRGAVMHLEFHGKVERIPSPMPTGAAQQKVWTGFDLKMLRSKPKAGKPTPVTSTREDRWAAKDDELRRMCQTMRVGPDHGGRKHYEPEYKSDSVLVSRVIAALETVSAETAVVLRMVYGRDQGRRTDVYGSELGPIAAMTPVVQREREKVAAALYAERCEGCTDLERLHARALREVRAEAILEAHAKDLPFVAKVRADAEKMLVRACLEYRKARGTR